MLDRHPIRRPLKDVLGKDRYAAGSKRDDKAEVQRLDAD